MYLILYVNVKRYFRLGWASAKTLDRLNLGLGSQAKRLIDTEITLSGRDIENCGNRFLLAGGR